MIQPPLAEPIVDWGQLGRVAVTAFLVGVGIPAAFSFGLLGYVRAGERRRQARVVPAVGCALLALAGRAVCVWAAYLAVTTVINK